MSIRLHRRSSRAKLLAFVVAACLLAHVQDAGAAEPTTEASAGGLTYAGLQILTTRQEDIVISVDRVRVNYTIQNTAPEQRTTLMAFALPDLDMMALDGSTIDNKGYDPLNPLNYVGFSALVDGEPAETYVETRALALGLVDATARLRELALPLYPLHPDLQPRLAALSETDKADLRARSLIRDSDGQIEPLWTLKTTLFWQQSFAAGQAHKVAISYRPIAGSSTWTAETAPATKQRYCIPSAAVAELDKRASGPQPVTLRWVHFIASAGALARGAVETYRIALAAGAPSQTVHTCRTGLVAESAAASREASFSDITADDEIQVLFVD